MSDTKTKKKESPSVVDKKTSPPSDQLPLLPLRDLIVFPHMMMPLFVGREKSIHALEEAMNRGSSIILAAQKDAKTNDPKPNEIYDIGTLNTIIQLLRLPDGTVKVLVEGKSRVKIKEYIQTEKYFEIKVEELKEVPQYPVEANAIMRSLKSTFENYVKLNKRIPPEILMKISSINQPSELADIVVAQLNLKIEDKQTILEISDPGERLEKLLAMMTSEIEILEVEKKIRSRVKKQMERSQKEYYLNEQMQAIQKELGEKDDFQAEIQELENQLKKKKMPEEALTKTQKEIKKLKMMSPMSAEATVIRNYIDWMISLPWQEYDPLKSDLENAEKILNADHYGLEKVKERILEHLAVHTLNESLKGSILCLVGPPGVGKTSLGKSVARAMNRKFVRISLGGVRDEAEIRGHRRTYVGAMPGRIIQSMKKADSGNPLMLLDEVDKMSTDFRGDPSSALLEVLDPEQNISFQDHYLEVEYDLSKVMFIATANSLHTIPKPLLDRMEVIHIEGYTLTEKFNIGKQYLLPKQIKNHGLKDKKVSFTDSALQTLIKGYTREAGVRGLERKISTICRKVAREILKKKTTKSITITPKKTNTLLEGPDFKQDKLEDKNEIGLTNGLAWTEVGGDLLAIEVSVVPGKGKFTLTGQLGDVMKESCSAALSYVRSRGPLFGFDTEFYQSIDVHIHAPEGAIPKDGPSAGIAIITSIVSAITKIPVKRAVAMTGEVTLRGRVLAIGGLKEKTLAAHRAGIKTVIIPKENEKSLKDIPKEISKDLKIILVDHVDQVLVNALDIKKASDLFKVRAERAYGIRAHYTGHSLQHH